jgi:hypothetical protein
MGRRWLFVPYFVVGATSCSDANKQTYAQAAVASVAAVGAVGIYRAITNDCWARCSPGYLCNEESGLCERGECLPACEFGTHCVRDVSGEYRCKSDLDNQAIQSSLNTTTAVDAGLASDAGFASDAAPVADAATSDAGATSSLFEQR